MGRLGRVTWKLPQRVLLSTGQLGSFAGGEERHDGRLVEELHFGSNPGNLRMLKHVPAGFKESLPLVVVLHGCKQTAGGYDRGAGWSSLADQYGFALLFPEQKRENNPNNCFTWFDAADTSRGLGEAASIKSMVESLIDKENIDPRRVYVTGLSAGGAMTSVMLATYPEVFSAGAIVAGLPYGAAGNVQEAFNSMFKGAHKTAEEWGALVRRASDHSGRWPRVSIWHGSADKTVVPANAMEIVKQWADVHGVMITSAVSSDGPGFTKRVWRDARGENVVESIFIPGLAHGTPLRSRGAGETCGEPGPYLIDAGVSSSHHIARFFGLIGPTTEAHMEQTSGWTAAAEHVEAARRVSASDGRDEADGVSTSISMGGNISDTITNALRAAGLMKR